MEKSQACHRCGGQRIVRGTLVDAGEWRHSLMLTFRPYGRKNFLKRLIKSLQSVKAKPYIFVDSDQTKVCIDCGLLWSDVSPSVVRQHLEEYGDENLRARLNLQ